MKSKLILALIATVAFAGQSFAASDAERAKAYGKKQDCFKCHAVDKTKKGPSYKKISEKYKGKPDAEAKMFTHLTKTSKVKLEDGTEEDHKELNKADAEDIKNVITWIREQ